MTITNLDAVAPYQLSPDAKIEIERTNPFFNDYGEQSIPIDLPASPHNRTLLAYPDIFGHREKPQPIPVSIQDGDFHAVARQYLLSAQRRGAISTSFYLGDGSFYSRIQNLQLKDIFQNDIITFQGATTADKVAAAIAYCRSLRSNADTTLTIFPVLLTDDSGLDSSPGFKILNAFGQDVTVDNQTYFLPDVQDHSPDDHCDFWGATARTEYVGGKQISLSPGYYISPFVRVGYVLRQLFSHFGYNLLNNIFTAANPAAGDPFPKMVLLNNVIDAIVSGQIRIADLLPDCTVADFLAVIRKKFCCEFQTDEQNMTATIVFFRNVADALPEDDLTASLVDEPVIAYRQAKDFKRVVLASKDTLDSDAETSYDNIRTLAHDNPYAYLDPASGFIYKGAEPATSQWGGARVLNPKIADASMPWNTGDELEEMKIEIPDCMPEFRPYPCLYHTGSFTGRCNLYFLYVGAYATRNSKVVTYETDNEDQENSEDAATTKVMLAFSYLTFDNRPAGTVTPYDMNTGYQFDGTQNLQPRKSKIFSYSLTYQGPDGIYERFWRKADTFYRNALSETKMKLLLSQTQKQNLSSWAKVTVRSAPFFINKLKFTLGGKNEPMESNLLSATILTPVNNAPPTSDFITIRTPTSS